ncbi:MAG: FkbM family methyltransferase [Aequorivita antarctica]
MNIHKKIIRRLKQFKGHPLTKEKPYGALWRYISFNLKNRLVQEQTVDWVGDLKFYARKGDAGLVGNIYYGVYEFEESIFLLHFLQEGDVFLDVGANLGHYSLLLSGIKKCRSIAVEPVPATYNQLVRNIKLNKLEGLIELHNLGVAEKAGRLNFSTDRNTMDRIVADTYKNSVQVSVSTIDTIVNHNSPLALKIDVEGYEYFALQGAGQLLESPDMKVVIIELNGSGKKYGIEDEKVFQMLLNKGFKPVEYDFKQRKLIELKNFNTHKFNTVFVRDFEFVAKRVLKSEKIKIKNRNI